MLITRLLPSTQRQRRREGSHKTRASSRCSRHLREFGRTYPAAQLLRVVLTIDNAPWHRGERDPRRPREHPNVELSRLPSYSSQLNVIERLWKSLRRATHNRLPCASLDVRRSARQPPLLSGHEVPNPVEDPLLQA